jgi:hypothetical protein
VSIAEEFVAILVSSVFQRWSKILVTWRVQMVARWHDNW